MPFLFQYFLELSNWGKVSVIAGYILAALILILIETKRMAKKENAEHKVD